MTKKERGGEKKNRKGRGGMGEGGGTPAAAASGRDFCWSV